MSRLALLLGGARSGKSDFAEWMAGRESGRVVYVATAEAGDEEMRERAVKHRARRPATWKTVEAPLSVAQALEPFLTDADVVLLDCLTLLASNVLLAEEASGRAEERLGEELSALLDVCRRYEVMLIMVSNEVGLGLVPPYALGRQYRDMLGRANQRLAAEADVVLYFIAGLPIDLKRLSSESLVGLGMLDRAAARPTGRVLDLTHPIAPDMPVWPGDPSVELAGWSSVAVDGYALRRVMFGEHSGTHIGVAAHLTAGGLSVDALPADYLVRPACVIDFRMAAARDADATLTVEDIRLWEDAHGRLPAGAVVLLATGWDQRWGDARAYLNPDGQGRLHFPGFGAAAARFLVEERQVVGLATDTAGIDPGADAALSANAILLQGERFHLENLTRLEQAPATGATLFIGALPIAGGGGAPARVLAWLPK